MSHPKSAAEQFLNSLRDSVKLIDTKIVIPAALLAVSFIALHRFYVKHLTRYKTSSHIPQNLLESKRHRLSGVITSVGDGDNFRLFHTPFLYSSVNSVPKERKKLVGETIHIRIAGVDAPECAHFGSVAQPFSNEALEWLRNYIQGKSCKVTLFSRDRYERIVGEVFIYRYGIFRRNVGLEMVKAGWADVYTQAGAEYGGKETFVKLKTALASAKRNRRGMWADGVENVELPSDFKKKSKKN